MLLVSRPRSGLPKVVVLLGTVVWFAEGSTEVRLSIPLVAFVEDKAVNAEDQITFCDEEPAYRRKQDTHREREREREAQRVTITK